MIDYINSEKEEVLETFLCTYCPETLFCEGEGISVEGKPFCNSCGLNHNYLLYFANEEKLEPEYLSQLEIKNI